VCEINHIILNGIQEVVMTDSTGKKDVEKIVVIAAEWEEAKDYFNLR
jgi:hypothetical protein